MEIEKNEMMEDFKYMTWDKFLEKYPKMAIWTKDGLIKGKEHDGIVNDREHAIFCKIEDDINNHLSNKEITMEQKEPITDKEVRELGWKGYESQFYIDNVKGESGWSLEYYSPQQKWGIADTGNTIYWGTIPDIQAMKQLMQWLKIPITDGTEDNK